MRPAAPNMRTGTIRQAFLTGLNRRESKRPGRSIDASHPTAPCGV